MLAERLAEDASRFASAWNFGLMPSPCPGLQTGSHNYGGAGGSWRSDEAPHPWEADYLTLDVSKAKAELGWEPVLPLIKALDWIVEWYRTVQTGSDLQCLTRRQIEQYETLLNQQNEDC